MENEQDLRLERVDLTDKRQRIFFQRTLLRHEVSTDEFNRNISWYRENEQNKWSLEPDNMHYIALNDEEFGACIEIISLENGKATFSVFSTEDGRKKGYDLEGVLLITDFLYHKVPGVTKVEAVVNEKDKHTKMMLEFAGFHDKGMGVFSCGNNIHNLECKGNQKSILVEFRN